MATDCSDYDFSRIEPHWQSFWEKKKTFRAVDFESKPKYYALDMYPYPSGAGLHIGHPEGYTASDILSRFKKANGFNVLHPMGWDAFGLPAEQYAIKEGIHPHITTRKNIDNFRRQIKRIGFAIDWDREINTTDPEYFKWTQWIFLQLFKKGLAYVDERAVWYCPELGTVLANEEVVDGKSEVGGHPVERRKLRQWVLRITAYADRLLAGLDELDWPDSTKRLQKNWIGRSEGAEVVFSIDGIEDAVIEVYTTRPDTLFGATYMVLAPEHPLVERITTDENREAVDVYVKIAAQKSDLDRTDLAKDKSGVFSGTYALNPVNGLRIPIWIADYVLISYGTGAIMAVPGHDERDFEFARKFELPIVRVIENQDADGNPIPLPYSGNGTMVNSGKFDGIPSEECIKQITEDLAEQNRGQFAVNYKLRDWLFSRQRYWGEPFPIVWVGEEAYEAVRANPNSNVSAWMPEEAVSYQMEGESLYALPIPGNQLPLNLPEMKSYKPSGSGESPLANATGWVHVLLNIETGETVHESDNRGIESSGPWFKGKRETNTMPQWAGSCWYYLRYCDPFNKDQLIAPDKEAYWSVPDLYIGGAEHAVLHLLYARFWHMVLFDAGVVASPEPFRKLIHQGIILGEMEFSVFKDKEGNLISAQASGEREDLILHRVKEDEIKKSGNKFVLKDNPAIQVDARSFKMSKSRGNVVNPDEVIDRYGSDSMRLFQMFLGPLEDMKPWNTSSIEGVYRFLKKIWRECLDQDGQVAAKIESGFVESPDTIRLLHETIRKVSEDIEKLRFNTAISQMMILLNHLQKEKTIAQSTALDLIKLLAPFAPHIAEELWERMGQEPSVSDASWPEFDPAKLVTDTDRIGFLVNGKPRGEAQVSKTASRDEVLAVARSQERIHKHLEGKTIRKVIFVPGRILNIVAN